MASAALASLVVHIVLALYLIQALLKVAVHFRAVRDPPQED